MKHLKLLLICLSFSVSLMISAQNSNSVFDFGTRPEAYFSFQVKSLKELSTLTHIVSIDKVNNTTVYAYANEQELTRLLKLGYSVDIQTAPSLLEHAVMKNWEQIQQQRDDWNYYPTYEAYVAMMNQFQTDYPNLCQIINFGTTNQNRELLICKIKSNVALNEARPQVLYTSSMHGDEVTGYVLMLRFIDYLLSNYNVNPEITTLLDQLEIWICPLANPDGTYHAGNSSVNGATRYNALGVDLNRNYKDFVFGDHPDDNSWQVETIAFMELQEQHHFILGVNIHGGAEVLNYPWDNNATRHADDEWFQYICREYVDTVHSYSTGNYMTELNNGITNGYDWYQISGSRQDYTNYYDRNREVTLEISYYKTPSASNLPMFWDYNYRSLINLLKQANFGIQGVITNCETQQPMQAKIFIENHDVDYSQVVSNANNGTYYRPIKAGIYNVTYSANGFYPQTFTININDHETFVQNVALCPGSLIADFSANTTTVTENETVYFTDQSFGNPTSWEWTFIGGIPAFSTEQNPSVTYSTEGLYDVMLVVKKNIAKEVITDTIIKQQFINVRNQYLMQNGTYTTCSGLFLDDGGIDHNYYDLKNYKTTFYPIDPTAKLVFTFTDFATESYYDVLKIYDSSNDTPSALIGSYSGSNSPGTITATNAQGALTFVFSSDERVNKRGWQATITCQGGSIEPPIADFSASVTDVNKGDTIQFSDLSINDPSEWRWTFEGGTPTTSTEQNPIVVYKEAGIFNVELTVSNIIGSDTKIKEQYITVHQLNILEENNDNDVAIFPNPSSEKATLQAKNKIQKIEIYSILGNLLQEKIVNKNVYELNTNDLRTGVYFVRIYIDTQIITKQLLIVK